MGWQQWRQGDHTATLQKNDRETSQRSTPALKPTKRGNVLCMITCAQQQLELTRALRTSSTMVRPCAFPCPYLWMVTAPIFTCCARSSRCSWSRGNSLKAPSQKKRGSRNKHKRRFGVSFSNVPMTKDEARVGA